MNQKINLKEIEKKTYRSTFEDGLYDIGWGLLLSGFGMIPLLKDFGFPTPLNLVLMPLSALLVIFLGKKYITVPRLGFVKFGKKRQAQKKCISNLASIIIPVQIALIIMVRIQALPNFLTAESNLTLPILISIFIIIIFAIIAHVINFPRFFIYGIFMAISYPTAEILYQFVGTPLDGLIPFGISGVILLFTGVIFLIRFLNKYPKSKLEVTNGNEN